MFTASAFICSKLSVVVIYEEINGICCRIFVDELFDAIMSQDGATTSKPKDFSSIARWLLLNKEAQSNPSKKFCQCNLCSRIRGITEERLTAPLEKPYTPVQNKNAVCGRPQFGAEGRLVIRNVRKFFEEFKDMLSSSGPALRCTILNMPVVLTSLACGVSHKTVTNHVHRRQEKKQEEKRVRQSILMKSYIAEWGVVVRHFVNNEIKEGLSVTVSDLYAKIRYAYADFPMPETKFQKFLKIIGFSVRVDEGKIYVVLRSDSESEVRKPKEELCEPKSEDVEDL
ncbi:hypothetical protein Aduo_017310 [Ancylostoma duodenale]